MSATPEHRWSGWPGAHCLDCGAPDQREVCLADDCRQLDWDTGRCPVHVNAACPEPGSRRHDPYGRGLEKRT